MYVRCRVFSLHFLDLLCCSIFNGPDLAYVLTAFYSVQIAGMEDLLIDRKIVNMVSFLGQAGFF
jgi:hypothetical protein